MGTRTGTKTGTRNKRKTKRNQSKRNQSETKQRNTKHNYTQKHFNSKDGMLTYVWGPPLWHFLHTMSFNYPLEPTAAQKAVHRKFMESLEGVLPCGKCRENLGKNYAQHPLLDRHLADRGAFSKYVFDLHEIVNTMLKKKSHLTYEEVRDRYEHFRARCRESKTGACLVDKGDKENKEKGCVEPVYGVKSKCVLNIVPLDTKCKTMTVDKRCKSVLT